MKKVQALAAVFIALSLPLPAKVCKARIVPKTNTKAEAFVYTTSSVDLASCIERAETEIDTALPYSGYRRILVNFYVRRASREAVCMGEKRVSRWLSVYDVFLMDEGDTVPKPRNFRTWSTSDEAWRDWEAKNKDALSRLGFFDEEAGL